ncbi:MAG TPA: T9SS type A sorting domain-containing protein, partial [Candidatus Acidoferrum sp.]|nr:T9SS type A sorting domain-containing protein [Candidatus Acidoferrum sp.]
IKVDQHDTIYVHIKDTLDIETTTSGRSRIVPTLSLVDAPDGVSFADHRNGTGTLTAIGELPNVGAKTLSLAADVGYFVDTTQIILWTYPKNSAPIIAYPNPFQDTLTVFIDSSNGDARSVTIFNAAGEKVWQQVNLSAGPADIIRWDGRNYAGRKTAAGVYILMVETDRRTETIKLLKTQ